MDISSISAVLGSIKTATEIAKLLKESDLSLEKAETKLKLAELISALADAKVEIAEIQQTILKKDDELRKLQEQFVVKEKLEWDNPYYWINDQKGKDGPFCQQCYDKNHELIRLQGDGHGWWECKACKSSYTDRSYESFVDSENMDDYDPFTRGRR
jgi:hypothetical protein